MSGSLLLRAVRLVAVTRPGPDRPVDLRVRGGVVTEVAPSLVASPDEQVVDAAGRWAAPGLWDAHVHLAQWAQARVRLDLSSARSPEQALALVRAHLAVAPHDRPVVGYGHRPATWARQPRVAELDAVSGGRAVVLVSGDAHSGWLSTAALARYGLPPQDAPLVEGPWFALLPRLDDLAGPAADRAYGAAVQEAATRGVVGVVDMEWGAGHREWPERLARGVDLLRVRAAVYPDLLDEVVDAGLRTGDPLPGGADLLTMGPLKVISDGSLGSRTAACCTPYADAADLEAPRGTQNHSRDELVALLDRARSAGLEAAVHVIGDAAATTALDAFAATGAAGSLEHLQLVDLADLPRVAALGLRASVQPAHLLDDRDATAKVWPDRADRCFALRSMADAGVRLALGSDAPVARLDPWLAMAAAVHRSGDDRPPWNPAESLTPREALAASTDGQGTLRPGARGDVVLLDDDPLRPSDGPARAAAQLRGTRVAATVLGGRLTHVDL
jgi:predicted amidohydrolase YtcJ